MPIASSGAKITGQPSKPIALAVSNTDINSGSALKKEEYLDQKLQDIGWRLAAGNAPFCAHKTRSTGLQLNDAASYRDPASIRQAKGHDGDFSIRTIAAQSPADLVNGLRSGQEITAINQTVFDQWEALDHSDWRRLKRAHDWIDKQLEIDPALQITLANGETITAQSVAICSTRFELGGRNKRALADGKRVVIGQRFVGFTYAEEELAAAIAHEFAHNLLGHRRWLAQNGRRRSNIRHTEREADRLMPWLLANAGYDMAAAQRFMEHWGPKHGGGIFRARTHDGWDERAEFIAAEIEKIRQIQRATNAQLADWQKHFERQN